MRLIRELAARGQTAAVLLYLDGVTRFWAAGATVGFSEQARENGELLRKLKEQIKRGKVPQHPN